MTTKTKTKASTDADLTAYDDAEELLLELQQKREQALTDLRLAEEDHNTLTDRLEQGDESVSAEQLAISLATQHRAELLLSAAARQLKDHEANMAIRPNVGSVYAKVLGDYLQVPVKVVPTLPDPAGVVESAPMLYVEQRAKGINDSHTGYLVADKIGLLFVRSEVHAALTKARVEAAIDSGPEVFCGQVHQNSTRALGGRFHSDAITITRAAAYPAVMTMHSPPSWTWDKATRAAANALYMFAGAVPTLPGTVRFADGATTGGRMSRSPAVELKPQKAKYVEAISKGQRSIKAIGDIRIEYGSRDYEALEYADLLRQVRGKAAAYLIGRPIPSLGRIADADISLSDGGGFTATITAVSDVA